MKNKFIISLVIIFVFIFSAESFAAKKKTPVTHPPVSQNVIDSISSGNLNRAIIAMREEPASPKLLYLTREVTRIVNFEMQEKLNKDDLHKVYQNVAIAYHNLYLFLCENKKIWHRDYR